METNSISLLENEGINKSYNHAQNMISLKFKNIRNIDVEHKIPKESLFNNKRNSTGNNQRRFNYGVDFADPSDLLSKRIKH